MTGQLTLQILDGELQSTKIPLRQGYIFSGTHFTDNQMQKQHAKVSLDSNFNWKINSLDNGMIRIGSEETKSISLIPGLVFHLGQTGFKVVERVLQEPLEWERISAEFIDNLDLQPTPQADIFFFLLPIQILFIQGPQSGTIYTLSYGPRILGSNHLDLNIKDPSQPHELLKFLQVGDKVIVQNLTAESSVLVNKNSFTQHTLSGTDRFTFGSNIIDISILK